jgi:hypothetical protein
MIENGWSHSMIENNLSHSRIEEWLESLHDQEQLGVTRPQHHGAGRVLGLRDLVAPGFGAASHRPGIRGRVASPRDSGPRRIAPGLGAASHRPGTRGRVASPSFSASPWRSSAMTASCSAEMSSRGEASPRSSAARRRSERPRGGLTDRPREQPRDPGAQLGGGLAAEGQDEDLLGIHRSAPLPACRPKRRPSAAARLTDAPAGQVVLRAAQVR